MLPIEACERSAEWAAEATGRYIADCTHDIGSFLARAAALEPEGVLTPFQSPRWLDAWLNVLGPAADLEPLLITVRDNRRGEIAMLLPLVLRRFYGVSLIEFADLSVSDYAFPLLGPAAPSTPEAAAEAFEAVAAVLPPADVLRVRNLPLAVGRRLNPLALLPDTSRGSVRNVMTLPASWDDYLAARPRKFRKALRQHHRAFDVHGGFTVRMITDQAEADHLLDSLDSLQRARIAARGKRYVLDRPVYSDFYRAVLAQRSDPGFAMLSVLESGGTVVAIAYSLLHQQTCTTVRLAHLGEQWSRCSPGIVLATELIRWLIDNGVRRFDLGAGGYDYKKRLGCEAEPLLTLERPMSVKGRMALSAWNTFAGRRSLIQSLTARPS
ncbi:GNAT family N-acetyltransferase [Rhodopseudomonas sp. HC1]|uniref:GNAT family N-acetyltransferase n=1 Tax=Rhodopseudomonas infernalis TaxID=2897386 RepID=UPI001EE919C9|nr:GNAT family N-acetyltransferase [Rhodopseudomonas infernalis]MCG6204323.1 GNAT family N-acetyltransferase [Rhodopseudomonas infernalis]